jgi:hypothetical protein
MARSSETLISTTIGLALAILLVGIATNGFLLQAPAGVYAQQAVAVPLPGNCSSPYTNGSPAMYLFHGVTFRFHVTYWCSPGGGGLVGNGSETSGQTYSFSLSGVPGPSSPTWYSPDTQFGVIWDRGSIVTLLVRT